MCSLIGSVDGCPHLTPEEEMRMEIDQLRRQAAAAHACVERLQWIHDSIMRNPQDFAYLYGKSPALQDKVEVQLARYRIVTSPDPEMVLEAVGPRVRKILKMRHEQYGDEVTDPYV